MQIAAAVPGRTESTVGRWRNVLTAQRTRDEHVAGGKQQRHKSKNAVQCEAVARISVIKPKAGSVERKTVRHNRWQNALTAAANRI
jgi:hypothetical protein